MSKTGIVFGFDEKYVKWGLSAVISLREIAKYSGDVFVTGNLNLTTQQSLQNLDVTLIQTHKNPFEIIPTFEEGIYAYWDADVIFQADISDIFSLVKPDKFACTEKRGFLVGSTKMWDFLQKVKKMFELTSQEKEVFKTLKDYFPTCLDELDETWNFTDISSLQLDKNKVIHFLGKFKDVHNNMFFWEKHVSLYNQYTTGSRKLVKSSKLS